MADDKDSRTAIIVALIGLAGVLIAAVITNIDKIRNIEFHRNVSNTNVTISANSPSLSASTNVNSTKSNMDNSNAANGSSTSESESDIGSYERELLTSTTARTVMLERSPTGSPIAGRARGKVIYEPSTGRSILFAYDMPPMPAGKTYQIWTIANNKPLPCGVFKPDDTGNTVTRYQIPPEGRNAFAFAITLEPQGGSNLPNGEIYLLGNVR